jgi:hypothetical protein
MVTKRGPSSEKATSEKKMGEKTEGKKTVKRKAKKTVASGSDGASMAVESGTATSASSRIDPEVRRQMVAAEAYFRAERRGFAAGQEVEDWIAAESEVDARFN